MGSGRTATLARKAEYIENRELARYMYYNWHYSEVRIAELLDELKSTIHNMVSGKGEPTWFTSHDYDMDEISNQISLNEKNSIPNSFKIWLAQNKLK